MTFDLLSGSLVEVTESFKGESQDGLQRYFRAIRRSESRVRDVSGGHGKRLCAGEAGCPVSPVDRRAIRTKVAVFHGGRSDGSRGVPRQQVGACGLCAET